MSVTKFVAPVRPDKGYYKCMDKDEFDRWDEVYTFVGVDPPPKAKANIHHPNPTLGWSHTHHT